jgi:hypothetical protein
VKAGTAVHDAKISIEVEAARCEQRARSAQEDREGSLRNGTNKLTMQEINRIIKETRVGNKVLAKDRAALINKGRGVLKREAGDKSLTDERRGHKKRERALEDRHVG